MWIHFIFTNAHFAINLFAALVFFAVFWLYYDAWKGRKEAKELVKIIGFFLLSFSFLLHAAHIETTVLNSSLLGREGSELAVGMLRILGYLFVIVSNLMDPLQPQPEHQNRKISASRVRLLLIPSTTISVSV